MVVYVSLIFARLYTQHSGLSVIVQEHMFEFATTVSTHDSQFEWKSKLCGQFVKTRT